MGKKYIIELEDNESVYKTVVANGYPMIQIIVPAPYTKPDLEQVRKEAYEQGLSDAWDAARKIVTTKGIPAGDMAMVFDDEVNYDYIFSHYSASEAIEKIRAYEQEKKEQIQVGDEIEAVSGKAVVVYVDDVDEHKVRYVYSNGVYAFNYIDKVTKTGRHFPEIAEVLAKMKES